VPPLGGTRYRNDREPATTVSRALTDGRKAPGPPAVLQLASVPSKATLTATCLPIAAGRCVSTSHGRP
jgi:hypothetical protein